MPQVASFQPSRTKAVDELQDCQPVPLQPQLAISALGTTHHTGPGNRKLPTDVKIADAANGIFATP